MMLSGGFCNNSGVEAANNCFLDLDIVSLSLPLSFSPSPLYLLLYRRLVSDAPAKLR